MVDSIKEKIPNKNKIDYFNILFYTKTLIFDVAIDFEVNTPSSGYIFLYYDIIYLLFTLVYVNFINISQNNAIIQQIFN